jgi:hypothetical protein
MPTVPTPRRRTIGMSEARSRMLACLAAYMNTTSEILIQSAISSLLICAAQNDKILACVIARAGGVDWQELETAQHGDVLKDLA